MTGVHLRCPKNVYLPLACPISATPAADPIESKLPPTPAVSVTSNHCISSITGFICRIATITGILSTMALRTPTRLFASVGPKPSYIHSLAKERYPIKPSPPTHIITPKKNNSVSHSARATCLKLSNAPISPTCPYSASSFGCGLCVILR